jgi:hypothetical protein
VCLTVRGDAVITSVVELTVPEKILLAAQQLDQQGQSPFSAEALIVAAWQQFPRAFGLKGYADQYPDSNKILTSIMGEKGLARRGWLVKMGQKLYAMSREGKQAARRLLQQEPEAEAAPTVRLKSDQERRLVNLLDSTAMQKVGEGRKNELTFADACRFWNVTENMRGDALDDRFDQFDKEMQELERILAVNEIELSNGRMVSPADVRVLGNVHGYMEDRFSRHLNLLRSRSSGR